jgi:hypothetical protein
MPKMPQMPKKKTSWDLARAKRLVRNDTLTGLEITLEPGVNFFVEAIERAGAVVYFSCEGHPRGFLIVFESPYDVALEIERSGFFPCLCPTLETGGL